MKLLCVCAIILSVMPLCSMRSKEKLVYFNELPFKVIVVDGKEIVDLDGNPNVEWKRVPDTEQSIDDDNTSHVFYISSSNEDAQEDDDSIVYSSLNYSSDDDAQDDEYDLYSSQKESDGYAQFKRLFRCYSCPAFRYLN